VATLEASQVRPVPPTSKIIDVESEFADFLEGLGAEVSDRSLNGPNKPINSDYIFHDEAVVAELKLLKRNPFENRDFLKSFEKKKSDWLDHGLITKDELARVTRISQLPNECYDDILKLYMSPVKQHIKSANHQIKKTKARMNLNDYKGLLFIGSEGNYFLQPEHVRHFIARILNPSDVYTSINTVVYLTVNVPTIRPNDLTPSRLWVNLYRDEEEFENVRLPFLKKLYNEWVSHYQSVTRMDIKNLSEMDEHGRTQRDLLKDSVLITPM
jgi:hypothetical protein